MGDTATALTTAMADSSTPIMVAMGATTAAMAVGVTATMAADGAAAAFMADLVAAVSHNTIFEIQDMLKAISAFSVTIFLVGCSTVPSGPSALALPNEKASESQFRKDEKTCRVFAHEELLGCSHKPKSAEEAQLHFDINYLQCMFTKGHLIPISGEILTDKTGAGPTVSLEKRP